MVFSRCLITVKIYLKIFFFVCFTNYPFLLVSIIERVLCVFICRAYITKKLTVGKAGEDKEISRSQEERARDWRFLRWKESEQDLASLSLRVDT